MRLRLLDEPGLNCPDCFSRIAESGIMPDCVTSVGCSIKEIATDPDVNEYTAIFMAAYGFYSMSGDRHFLDKVYSELGFKDDLIDSFELEGIFIEWKSRESKKQAAKNNLLRKR